ncbi:MAG: hypothetical protein L0Y66_22330 [Myxococcaceae bacterium]|nr:hypothetical protein [Myxococcaceae bacterium]
MDAQVIQTLKDAGLALGHPELLTLAVQVDEGGRVLPLAEEVVVSDGRTSLSVRLPKLSRLFTGTRVPADLSGEPPEEYKPFFLLIERTAALYCRAQGKPERDEEFERLYRHLHRRPDGTDANPLFSYLQGACRLYLSVREGSQAEFEAVAKRLSRSARTFRMHLTSTNYFKHALSALP